MKTTILVLSTLILSSGITQAATSPTKAYAQLESPRLKILKSDIKLEETSKGIIITAEVSGLRPGSVHGFHIHEKGECKGPDFESAGGHLNPTHHEHNAPTAESKHLGDLGNIVANDRGVAKTEVVIPAEEGVKLSALTGKAFIMHDKPDDMSSQPAGNAGDRLACGIIKTL